MTTLMGGHGVTRAGSDAPTAPVVPRVSHANQAKLFSTTSVLLFLVLAVGFYCSTLGWTVSDTLYFACVTFTTVGYGDYNGSANPSSMQLTAFFGFLAVGVIGVAVSEIASYATEVKRAAEVHALECMVEAIENACQWSDVANTSTQLQVVEMRWRDSCPTLFRPGQRRVRSTGWYEC